MERKRGIGLLLGWVLVTSFSYVLFPTATAILFFLLYLPVAAALSTVYDKYA